MNVKWNKLLALTLGLSLLAACGPKEAQPTPTPETTASPEVTATPAPEGTAVNVAMLKGPTGLGAARLMAQSDAGETVNDYTFSVLAEPAQAVAALTSGEVDIAAVPTNMASILYHKPDVDIQLLALNTLGVLYILERGDTVNSLADLAGKTVYATGQGANPEYALNYLLRQNGLEPGEDVTIEWKATGDEVAAGMTAGEIDLAMLPVPAATSVLIQNQDVRKAVSLTEEWEKAGADGVLTMGCVVARAEFAQAHPEAVDTFLTEYGTSIAYMSDEANRDDAAALAETYGIVPKAAVAKKALPDANLCFITGDDMIDGIQGYYEVLFAADPASIGGSIPDGAFYYHAKS
ncbi:PhnD/SsuA/transferrin family substrate-binding protein [Pseudoflavonifractor phocaeensis]|uniref:ABC transporter substrate-binding protein n=1 Tax=Pseudoflavonifractor phocaeensis TaxID=1870988 RepID=UPI00313C36E1